MKLSLIKKTLVVCLFLTLGMFTIGIYKNLKAQGGNNVIAAAGDIASASSNGNHAGTANVVQSIGPVAVLVLGDNQYPDGTLAQYQAGYNNTWGRFKAITYPVPGNHEYHVPNGQGYFDYFGTRAGTPGKGWYSYNLAGWHFIALNSEQATNTEQRSWLEADLAANRNTACTLAYWHHPRWSSGQHGDNARSQSWVDLLYQNKADIILAGHDHTYERFAPKNPAGQVDAANGIRQFVSGAGGAGLYSLSNNSVGSEFKQNTAHGVLKLTLNPTSYSWQFISTTNAVLDSGSGNCVGGGGPGPTGNPPTVPPGPTNPPPPTPPSTPAGTPNPRADVNGDGRINIVDIGIIVDDYGRRPPTNPKSDVNNDTRVDIVDIGIVVDFYGR